MSRQVRHAGDSAVLLELEPIIDLEVNAQAIGIAASTRRADIEGVRDVISTYRSVAVHFDPLRTDFPRLLETLARMPVRAATAASGRTVEVPVRYGGADGPDLHDVAAMVGLPPDEVVARHVAGRYRVFMMGFMPGFAYLGPLDPRLAVPRRGAPRVRVPARSVALAGQQTGIYPRESPGGWQIIGRAAVEVFDPARAVPSLLAPGDMVRFVMADDVRPDQGTAPVAGDSQAQPRSRSSREIRGITVLQAGLLTTIQDLGRWGFQDRGVPVSGPMDALSHRLANLLVGNDERSATLEATLVGPELRMDVETVVAVTGADLGATLDGRALSLNQAITCPAGAILRLGERRAGTRAYIGIAGGIDVPEVLGSRATHVTSRLGGQEGRPLRPGDRLPIGTSYGTPRHRPVEARPVARGGARVRAMPGPQANRFSRSALDAFHETRFTISPQSDRVGYRLAGARVDVALGPEMISDAAFRGSIQIPPSGNPILLMADAPTTGGYPQLATVITADLPVAGQLGPGDWIEFEVCSREEAVAALIAREGELLAIG